MVRYAQTLKRIMIEKTYQWGYVAVAVEMNNETIPFMS